MCKPQDGVGWFTDLVIMHLAMLVLPSKRLNSLPITMPYRKFQAELSISVIEPIYVPNHTNQQYCPSFNVLSPNHHPSSTYKPSYLNNLELN